MNDGGHARIAPDVAAALAGVRDGMSVGIGGALNAGHPMALVRGLMQKAPADLTLVAGFGSFDLDMIVGMGLARRLVAAFVGAEGVAGLPPMIRWACEEGRLETWDFDEGLLLQALKAASQRVPYTTWRAGLGTDAANNPLTEIVEDGAAPYLKVKPLPLDVALYWAEAADRDGNVRRWGPDFGDIGLVEASAHRIVQVERLLPSARLADDPERVMPWQADVVLVAPLGTWPFSGTAIRDDLAWLQGYMERMEACRRAGDLAAARAALSDMLCLDGDDDALLSAVGVPRLRELLA